MDTIKKSYLQLHFSVFLWGFTAILGALITLEALDLVWWRMLITSLSFVLLLKGFKAYWAYPLSKVLSMMGIGCIVALHWLCFYGSVKLANASVALIGVSTAALFSSLFEPLVFKKKISKLEVFLGLMVIPGIALIVNTLRQDFHLGLYVGIASGILASTFTVLNKKTLEGVRAKDMSFVELSAGFLFLSIFMPFFGFSGGFVFPQSTDIYYLLLLSVGCTTLPFVLSLEALKHLSAFITNLSVNLEPIYGLILAVVILKENQELNFGFYLGCLIILVSVFSYPLIKARIKRRDKYEFS
jgi:drug/metabolite transporter (DMT)-like permease